MLLEMAERAPGGNQVELPVSRQDAISGYIEGMLDSVECKPISYALDARKVTLAQFLEKMIDRQDNTLLPEEHLAA